MGVRVPTILVSPWISEKTVFRSESGVAYDSTSILATLLNWLGVPKSKWGLGERTNTAPTFEGVLQAKAARTDKLSLTPPWDGNFPFEGQDSTDRKLNDLHRLQVPRIVADLTKGHVSSSAAKAISDEILASSPNQAALHQHIDNLHKKYKGS